MRKGWASVLRIRTLALLTVLVGVLLAIGISSASAAAPPGSGPAEFKRFDFESAGTSFDTLSAFVVAGGAVPKAYWGVTSSVAQTGTHSLWCAATTYPGGDPSSYWPTYAIGTAGDAATTVTETADYYSSSVAFSYLMPTLGSADHLYVQLYDGSGNFKMADTSIPLTTAWTARSYDLAPLGLSRSASKINLRFVDQYESIGGLGGGGDALGKGPAVDNVVFSGYKYGPIRTLSVSSPVSGQVALSWPVPYAAIGSTLADNRSITYKVWRSVAGTDIWEELTAGGRVAVNAFTDVTASPDTHYRYVVQAWDPGTGAGRGEQSPTGSWPAALVLGDPSKPSGTVYTWKSFTAAGTVSPALAGGSSIAIQCSRDKVAITKTYSGHASAGGTTYSVGGIKLPAAGTWYVRAYRSDSTYGVSKSGWTTVHVSAAVQITAPTVKSTMSVNKTYTVSGTVMPRHSSGTYLKVYAYRWNNTSFAYVKSFSVKVTSSGQPANTTKYTSSVKLTQKGIWELRVKHSAHGVEATTYSPYSLSITVK